MLFLAFGLGVCCVVFVYCELVCICVLAPYLRFLRLVCYRGLVLRTAV